MRRFFAALLGLLSAVPAIAQTPAIDPGTWKGQQEGAPTQVVTLATANLGQMETLVTPEMLLPPLAKLAAFKPDVITYEGISSQQCDVLRRYPGRYAGMF